MELLRQRWCSPAFHMKVFNTIYTHFDSPLPRHLSSVILSAVSLPRQKSVESRAGIANRSHIIKN
jgi:hypothetical protein